MQEYLTMERRCKYSAHEARIFNKCEKLKLLVKKAEPKINVETIGDHCKVNIQFVMNEEMLVKKETKLED